MNASITSPTHSIPLNKQIYCFQLSRYDCLSNLFCAALQHKVVIGQISFPVNVISCLVSTTFSIRPLNYYLFHSNFGLQEENDNDEFLWEELREIDHDTRCHAIAIAPDTSLLALPKLVKFCTADADFIIRVYRTNLDDSDSVQCLKGHTSYVNDVAWEPSTGKYLASVSDDHSCQIRSQKDDFEVQTTFRFKSPGIIVRWHPDDTDKLLVAEKRGTIHIYNILSKQIALSIETTKAPLMSADWSIKNHLMVTALSAGEIITFDLRYP